MSPWQAGSWLNRSIPSFPGAQGSVTPGSVPSGLFNSRRTVVERIVQGAGWLTRACSRSLTSQRSRRLRIRETVSLGEKRFLCIVQIDDKEYLIGGGTTNVSMLTRLEGKAQELRFDETLEIALQETTPA